MTNEINNFWNAYLNNEEDDLKETRDFLKNAGVDIDKARNEFSKLLKNKGEKIKQETATIRMQEGKRKQKEFNNNLEITDRYSNGGEIVMNYAHNVQFRNGEEISENEKKNTENKDKRAMEILKKINNEANNK